MPPKKATSTFFNPGHRESVPVKKAAPKKKANPITPPALAPPKETFFKPGFRKAADPPAPAAPSFTRQPFVPRRSFLYNKETGEPYAEWVGNEALCLDTGEVIFESSGEGYLSRVPAAVSFDFTPPKHKNPKDPSIGTQDLIDTGVISFDDFRKGNSALSVEKYEEYKKKHQVFLFLFLFNTSLLTKPHHQAAK
jgi:hypothetical protein